MFGMHLAKRRGKIIAVADIGSASAALAIVALEPGAPARVLVAERSVLPLEERSKEATVAAIGEHLVQVGEKMLKAYVEKGGGKAAPVAELYCIIHAPWIRSRSARADSTFEQETPVASVMMGALAKDALEHEGELDHTNILEASVIRVELNEYPTGVPVGKKARTVSLFALASDCDQALRAEVQASLEKLFPHITPIYRSSTRAVLSALREQHEKDREFFIVDMVSEGTSLIAVRDGMIAEQQFLAEGVRSILKRITVSGMPEETLSLIRMLNRDQCSSAACEALQSSMAKIEPELVRIFGEGMTACAPVRRLPNKLALVVQPEMVPWLSKFFSRIDFTQFTLTSQPFSVDPLSPQDLSHSVIVEHPPMLDIGVALAVALVNREQGD